MLEITDIETDPEVMVVVAEEIVLVREGGPIKMSNKGKQETNR
jgi:hypothetical protein